MKKHKYKIGDKVKVLHTDFEGYIDVGDICIVVKTHLYNSVNLMNVDAEKKKILEQECPDGPYFNSNEVKLYVKNSETLKHINYKFINDK